MESKVKSVGRLKVVLNRLKKQGEKIVFTNGCFDILHVGHLRYLKQARKLGDRLVVAVNSDSSVKKLKGNTRPILPQAERVEILSEFPFIDFVVIFNEETPYKIIKTLLPDVLVKGGDWKTGDIVGGDLVKENGGKVAAISYIKGKSTTNIIDRVIKQCEKVKL
jgi:D-beta-D-heptose 7-phosphate kinase/D-beta-D-heptose 1-phosphate adenosyltransferase